MYIRLLTTALIALFLLPATQAFSNPVGHLRVANTENPVFGDLDRSAKRSDYVVLQSWETDVMRRLKAANPNMKVLMYKNLSFVADRAPADKAVASGVSINQARQNPSWLLRDRSGNEIRSRNWQYNVAMDIGDSGYQQAWAQGVKTAVAQDGWDGVFLDDVNTTFRYHQSPATVAKYPTDAAYSAATGSMLQAVRPTLASTGKLTVANVGSWTENPEVATDWLGLLDGVMEENFTKWDSGPGEGFHSEGSWRTQQAAVRRAQQMGKIYLGVSHSNTGDRRAGLYGYASLLLEARGKAAFTLQEDYRNDPTWLPEYDYTLGNATGAASESGGIHTRRFANGIVAVNPTDRTRVAQLGATYVDASGAKVATATLAPNSAVVMRGSGTSLPPAAGGIPSCAIASKRGLSKRKIRARISACRKIQTCVRASQRMAGAQRASKRKVRAQISACAKSQTCRTAKKLVRRMRGRKRAAQVKRSRVKCAAARKAAKRAKRIR